MAKAPRPHPTPRRAVVWLVVAACAAVAVAAAAGLIGTPYAHVADELLERLHVERVPCPVTVAEEIVCFVAEPARAAPLAEALEAFVAEHAGALAVGPWRSGNGAHQVTLHWVDDLWGGLEVWLAELGATRVEGRLEHVPKRRD